MDDPSAPTEDRFHCREGCDASFDDEAERDVHEIDVHYDGPDETAVEEGSGAVATTPRPGDAPLTGRVTEASGPAPEHDQETSEAGVGETAGSSSAAAYGDLERPLSEEPPPVEASGAPDGETQPQPAMPAESKEEPMAEVRACPDCDPRRARPAGHTGRHTKSAAGRAKVVSIGSQKRGRGRPRRTSTPTPAAVVTPVDDGGSGAHLGALKQRVAEAEETLAKARSAYADALRHELEQVTR